MRRRLIPQAKYDYTVLGIQIRRIRMFLGLRDPGLDPFFRGMDHDPDLSLFS
jgi:hypothetical protein